MSFFIFVAAIDNIQMTIESQKSLLYEVASVSSNAEEFIIRPMLHGANVNYAFDFYVMVVTRVTSKKILLKNSTSGGSYLVQL